MMVEAREYDSWRGRELVDVDGQAIGTIARVFAEASKSPPAWALVTPVAERCSCFVPVGSAQVAAGAIRVSFACALVRDAPAPQAQHGLSLMDAATLLGHYGFEHLPARGQGAGQDDRSADLNLGERSV